MDEEKYNLIINAQKGDKNALEKLIKTEQKSISLMLYYLKKDSKDISDITQEILLKISSKIHQLKNPNYFKTWLNQIVINSYYDYLRKNKKHINEIKLEDISKDVINNMVDFETNPQSSILNNELDFVIKTSIENLPIHYKIPITLREIQGLSYDEISNITKTTVGTVKSRIARARAKIKDDILKYSGE